MTDNIRTGERNQKQSHSITCVTDKMLENMEFHVHGLYHWAKQILLNSNVTYLLVHVMKMGCSSSLQAANVLLISYIIRGQSVARYHEKKTSTSPHHSFYKH